MRIVYIWILVGALAACGDSDGDSGDSDSGPGDGDGGGNGSCSQDPNPTGPDSPCPDPCDTCAGGLCTIDCSQGNCGSVMDCPQDYDCLVLCDGVDACDGGGVNCSPDNACSVVCSNGNDACGDFELTCGSGSCSIECGDDTCSGAVVHCGDGSCSATCTGANPAAVECGSSCGCTEC